MSSTFRAVGLIGRHKDPHVSDSLRALADHLVARGVAVLAANTTRADFAALPVERVAEDELAARCELIVAVGGDGTMLHAAALAAPQRRPLLGVNRGRLGFLADVSPDDMLAELDAVLAGDFVREDRLLLQAGLGDETRLALNDVVVSRTDGGRMIAFETWIGGRYVNTHQGDGLIVSTPTGSTAYALSGGGPIIAPDLDAMVLVPICPHTLADRPVVVRAGSALEIRLLTRKGTRAEVTCDGHRMGKLAGGTALHVRRAEFPATLLHPRGFDYFSILRTKLRWGNGGP